MNVTFPPAATIATPIEAGRRRCSPREQGPSTATSRAMRVDATRGRAERNTGCATRVVKNRAVASQSSVRLTMNSLVFVEPESQGSVSSQSKPKLTKTREAEKSNAVTEQRAMKMRELLKAAAIIAATAVPTTQAAVDTEACLAHLGETGASTSADGKVLLQAAGASFPNKLYQDAMFAYGFEAEHVAISYTSTGSGKGKCRIQSYCDECDHPYQDDPGSDNIVPGNIDFAGSDSLLKDDEYNAYPDLQMYPAVAGAVVPIFNLKAVGITDLVLNTTIVAQIFRKCLNVTDPSCLDGDISLWNDPRIVELNPTHETALNNAGAIKVIVRGDKSGTTEIFKKSLASFEAAFDEQIGTSSSAVWNNADVEMVNKNDGVAARVVATGSSIGYSVLAEAMSLQVPTAKLLQAGSNDPVEASPESVGFGVMEKGLQFGNNGDPVTRLTADIHNAVSSFAWPIIGYTYFVVRKNAGRYGGDCTNRIETYKYLEWFYTNEVVGDIASRHGFAMLPSEIQGYVLERLREQMLCEGSPVYQPSGYFEVKVKANPAMKPLMELVFAVYRIVNPKVTAELTSESGSISEQDLVANLDSPTLKIDFASNVPDISDSVRAVPLMRVSSNVIFSLCGTDPSCELRDVDVSLSIETLAGILDGSIGFWDDAGVVATRTGGDGVVSSVTLPHEAIVVVRTTNAAERSWDSKLEALLSGLVAGFGGFTAETKSDSYLKLAQARVFATPFSMVVAPDVGSISSLGSIMSLVNADGQIEDPLVFDVSVAFPIQFSDAFCRPVVDESDEESTEVVDDEADDETLYVGEEFAQLIFWLVDPQNLATPLEQNNVVFAASTKDVEEAQVSVMCNGVAVMEPEHELNVAPGVFRTIIFAVVTVLLLVCVAMMLYIYANRRMHIIRASTWSFLIHVLIGVVMSLSTVFPLLQDDRELYELEDGASKPTAERVAEVEAWLSTMCNLVPTFFFIGYGLVATPLLLKTWRINKLFHNKSLRKIKISNKMLAKYEAFVLGCIGSVLVAWTTADPLVWERVIDDRDTVTGLPVVSRGMCVGENVMTFLTPLAVFVIATLFYGNYLSYKARNIPSDFSEGKWIAISLINFLECFVLCIPILVITADNPGLDAIVKVMFILMVNMGTLGILYVPKMVSIFIKNEGISLRNSSRTSRRNAGSTTNGGTSALPSTAQSSMREGASGKVHPQPPSQGK